MFYLSQEHLNFNKSEILKLEVCVQTDQPETLRYLEQWGFLGKGISPSFKNPSHTLLPTAPTSLAPRRIQCASLCGQTKPRVNFWLRHLGAEPLGGKLSGVVVLLQVWFICLFCNSL